MGFLTDQQIDGEKTFWAAIIGGMMAVLLVIAAIVLFRDPPPRSTTARQATPAPVAGSAPASPNASKAGEPRSTDRSS